MRRVTAAAVITAPVLFLIVNVLHPKEYRHNHEAQQLKTIADHYQRWQIAHFLTFVSLMIFAVAVLGLAWLLYSRRPGAALLGGILGIWGLIALGGVLALDGFTWAALGQVYTWKGADKGTLELALHSVQQSHWSLPFYGGALVWIIGLLVLSIGLIRQHLVSAWAGVVFALGVVMVGIEAGIPNNVYFIVSAAVLALGGIGVGVAISHDDDSADIGNIQPG